MTSKSKRIRAAVLIIIAVLGSIFIWQGNYITSGRESALQVFIVERGMGVSEIADGLKHNGLIKSKSLFGFLALLLSKQDSLMAGAYELSADMSISEILGKLYSGDVLKKELTIIEGWNSLDIARALENEGMFQAEELFELIGFPSVDYSAVSDLPALRDFSDDFSFLKLKPSNVGLEGYLFPDTYQMTIDEPLESILYKILDNFEQKITLELQEEIIRQKKTLFEVLTMASLLEKEVKTYKDRQIVAGILWKRLNSYWPLQVDATITYLTGKTSAGLTEDDLNINSLYNTYKQRGLPLGPICNPGIDSIKAAVYYTESPYWFYLSAKNGETIFSKTLEQHVINKQKYLN